MKTEHAGAKNGGSSFYGRRVEAKAWSRVHRRLDDGAAVAEQLEEVACEPPRWWEREAPPAIADK